MVDISDSVQWFHFAECNMSMCYNKTISNFYFPVFMISESDSHCPDISIVCKAFCLVIFFLGWDYQNTAELKFTTTHI